MNYLALEASATAASCALLEDDKVLGEFFVNIPQTHSQTLLPMAESLLKTCRIPLSQLDFLAVTQGPGSFTGLRIAMAAVKGMAMAAQKPCVGVSTLEALAHNLEGFSGSAAAVMDARCAQVYAGLFALEDGKVTRTGEDEALAIADLEKKLALLPKPVFLVGDGAVLCYNTVLERNPQAKAWLRLAPAHLRYQRAAAVAAVALERFRAGEGVDCGRLVPVYLRQPQAQRELLKRTIQEESK